MHWLDYIDKLKTVLFLDIQLLNVHYNFAVKQWRNEGHFNETKKKPFTEVQSSIMTHNRISVYTLHFLRNRIWLMLDIFNDWSYFTPKNMYFKGLLAIYLYSDVEY